MPYTPDIACIAQTGGLETASCMNEPEKDAMFTLNAVALVPRLADILHVSATGNALCYTNASLSIRENAADGYAASLREYTTSFFNSLRTALQPQKGRPKGAAFFVICILFG